MNNTQAELQRAEYYRTMVRVARQRGMTDKEARAFAQCQLDEQAQLKFEEENEKRKARAEKARETRARNKARENAAP